MTVALARDVEKFLKQQVRSGEDAEAADFVNNALRFLRDHQSKVFKVTPDLEAWMLQAADQPTTPLTHADFEGIRKRGRKRAAPKRA